MHADSGATSHLCHADYTEVQPAIQRYSEQKSFEIGLIIESLYKQPFKVCISVEVKLKSHKRRPAGQI